MALLIAHRFPERWTKTERRKRQSSAGRAIRLIIRQELERVRTSSSTSEEHRDIPGSKRALAISKTEAAERSTTALRSTGDAKPVRDLMRDLERVNRGEPGANRFLHSNRNLV